MKPMPLSCCHRLCRLLGTAALAAGLAACGGEISGTVTGLGAGRSVTLQNNGADSLTITRNGEFAFADMLENGASYAVTVQIQPVGQTCSVANGTGTIDTEGSSVDNVRVDCVFSSTLRGTVTGLLAGAAVTLINGSEQLAVAADGAFSFATVLADGSAYDLRVLTQPTGQTCNVPDGVGSFVAASFVGISVICN